MESNHQLSTVSLESKPKPHGTISLLWMKTSAQSHTLRFALNPHTHIAKTASAPPRRVWQRRGVVAAGVSRKTSGCLRAPTTRNGRGKVSTRLTGLTQCFVSSNYRRSLLEVSVMSTFPNAVAQHVSRPSRPSLAIPFLIC